MREPIDLGRGMFDENRKSQSTMKNEFCKKLLRKSMKMILNDLSEEERRRQSEAVMRKLIRLPQYRTSERVSIYLSTNNEIDTLLIIKHMFTSGKQIFIPKYKGKAMQMVKLHSIEDYHQLPRTKWDIKQPANNDVREDALDGQGLDLICLPGLAFTKCGKRLGHGMGYYDKYLTSYASRKERMPLLVALAFNEQLLDDVPVEQHDFKLDLILAESSFVYDCPAQRKTTQ